MIDLHTGKTIAVIALVTILLRFLPFFLFRDQTKTPKLIEKLGRVLPYAIMGMLVIYCVKGVSFTEMSGFLPTLVSCAVVGGLYLWKRNTLLSIICGTACYMFFVQVIF